VDGLADQLASAGVPCYIITIGQNSGHYLAPNDAYDGYVGISPSKCSRRDLVADLSEALRPRGIRLMVYLPSGAPGADPVAVERLEWEWGFEGGWPEAWKTTRTGKRLVAFQRKWEAVTREWSLRWSDKVSGWYIDGCYFADEMYRHDDSPNFASFAAAIRAGNPDSIVCFNHEIATTITSVTEHEDYTAGEFKDALPACPGPWVERDGHKARYHINSYLGQEWGEGEPRFPDELVVGYTKHVMSKGGVVTWDAPLERSGLIRAPFVDQLVAIGQSMKTR
jgi:alpha-L-fucosidase